MFIFSGIESPASDTGKLNSTENGKRRLFSSEHSVLEDSPDTDAQGKFFGDFISAQQSDLELRIKGPLPLSDESPLPSRSLDMNNNIAENSNDMVELKTVPMTDMNVELFVDSEIDAGVYTEFNLSQPAEGAEHELASADIAERSQTETDEEAEPLSASEIEKELQDFKKREVDTLLGQYGWDDVEEPYDVDRRDTTSSLSQEIAIGKIIGGSGGHTPQSASQTETTSSPNNVTKIQSRRSVPETVELFEETTDIDIPDNDNEIELEPELKIKDRINNAVTNGPSGTFDAFQFSAMAGPGAGMANRADLYTPITLKPQSGRLENVQVVRLAELIISAQDTQKGVRVQLNPPDLGRVHLDFQFASDESIRIVINTETAIAGQLMRDSADSLLASLKTQGMENVELQFETPQDNSANMFFGNPESEQSRGDSNSIFADINSGTQQPDSAQPTRAALLADGLSLDILI